MELHEALTSWAIFGTVIAAGCYYYGVPKLPAFARPRDSTQNEGARRRQQQESRSKQDRRITPNPSIDGNGEKSSLANTSSQQNGGDGTRKRKLKVQEPAAAPTTPSVVVQGEEAEDIDMNTRQWAQQMMQTRKGHEIGAGKTNEQRIKTVKQSSAMNSPLLSSRSSQEGAEADDDLSPAVSPALNAGDVSDMLEPVASGPSTLRVTAPTIPQKEKVARKPKEEQMETKKQRQNRKKADERRMQQEADEQARRVLEEKQRRSAREARGEPARNGMQPSKAPSSNAWTASASGPSSSAVTAPMTNGNQNGPLLDTFDADSVSSSNGGMEASTAATSTTSGGAGNWDQDMPSEEEQMARAMRQSEDESGWTTVAQPKKAKKKAEIPAAEPVVTTKTNLPTPKPAVNGKPKGFQALDVQYEQRADADPNDASNWDA